ncbi:MAG: class I SAM-dependent methyltransferase [Deltaproteobacteria bacterium]|nr:class I SAM-dependent methyltransferase [Deltaproteobacteria bacterium]
MTAHYHKEYWQETPRQNDSGINLLYSLRMRGVISKLRRLLPAGGRIVDVGAGACAFMACCEKAGFDAWGVDKFSSPHNITNFQQSDLTEAAFPDSFFDAVTFFHVIEHLADPKASLIEAVRILKPGGLIVIETPNIDSLWFRIFKNRWQPLEFPTHFNFFNPASIAELAKSVGNLEIIFLSQFSLRASPAALVLSLFPGLQPKRMRVKRGRGLPFIKLIAYLCLQLAALPLTALTAAVNKGCIMRIYLKKRSI